MANFVSRATCYANLVVHPHAANASQNIYEPWLLLLLRRFLKLALCKSIWNSCDLLLQQAKNIYANLVELQPRIIPRLINIHTVYVVKEKLILWLYTDYKWRTLSNIQKIITKTHPMHNFNWHFQLDRTGASLDFRQNYLTFLLLCVRTSPRVTKN